MNASHLDPELRARADELYGPRTIAMAHSPEVETAISQTVNQSEELMGRLQRHSAEDFDSAAVELGSDSGLELLKGFASYGEKKLVPALITELHVVRGRLGAIEALALSEGETLDSLRAGIRRMRKDISSNLAGTIAASLQTPEPRRVCLSIDNHGDRFNLTEAQTKKLFDLTRERARQMSLSRSTPARKDPDLDKRADELYGTGKNSQDAWVDDAVNKHNQGLVI